MAIRKRLGQSVLFLGPIALIGCLDSTGPKPVSTVHLSAPSDVIMVGDSVQVTASARDANGKELEVTDVVWSVRDDSIAMIVGNGRVIGKQPGQTVIYGEVAGRRGEIALNVIAQPVASIRIVPDTITLVAGTKTTFAASPRNALGEELTGRKLNWSSDDAKVAGVDSAGVVTARTEGLARITVESEGKAASATVTVTRAPTPELRTELVAGGFLPLPTHVASTLGDGRVYVVERDGQIRIIRDGLVLPEPFLDLKDRILVSGEGGMFSIAFHPRYESNGYAYVNFTEGGALRIVRFTATADRTRLDRSSEKAILSVGPMGFHFGGLLEFGPDGKLYIPVGEGGVPESAQDKRSLMGKILRVDVDAGDPYAIPADNPFVSDANARGEIWAMGLRNPWRISIDPVGKAMYIADVGGNYWEEINVAPLGGGGLNFGWPHMEGAGCQPETRTDCLRAGLTLPVVAYPHGERGTGHPFGCSITGGSVYRGSRMPGLYGHYFYGDFCRPWVRSFRYVDGKVADVRDWPFESLGGVVSFGTDATGEVYAATRSGNVHLIRPTNDR